MVALSPKCVVADLGETVLLTDHPANFEKYVIQHSSDRPPDSLADWVDVFDESMMDEH